MTSPATPTSLTPPAQSPSAPAGTILAAAWMVTAIFILSNSATPLYVHWQRRFAFSAATSTLIFTSYILGLVSALLLAAPLSERYGRKAVLAPAFLLAMVACALFGSAGSATILIVARFFTGVAVGVVVAIGMAAVVQAGGPDRQRQAAQAASVAMVLGAALGPLLAGALAQVLADPVPVIFISELVLLATALVTMFRLPMSEAKTARIAWKLPSVQQQHQAHLICGIAVFAPGLAATSFVLSLGPALLSRLLHVNSPLLAGGTACLMFVSATGVQLAAKDLAIRTIQLTGAAATACAMVAMTTAIHAASPLLLLVAAILAGVGQGLGQLAGLSAIGMYVPDTQRTQAISLLNIGAYIPAGILAVASGVLMDRVGMAIGASIFSAVLFIGALSAAYIIAAHQPRSIHH